MSYIHHLENQLEDETRGQEIVTPTTQSSCATDSNNNVTDTTNCSSNDQVDSPKVNTKYNTSWYFRGLLEFENTEMNCSSGASC